MATPLITRVASLPVLRKRFPGFPCRRGRMGLGLMMERGLRSEDMAPTLAVAVAVDGDMDMEGRKEGTDEAGPFAVP
ncbi:hypothetical protein E4U38_004847 [Claviceps purpurea]|nr:hypothetical protein E4U38_004847 [Claviceps purpurea]KAG6193183.1 hypothetical protein E4U27_000667 [Claviceps purpurea]KAG6290132.1 hypothetical protein E4U46_002010 [Claviceps purpurea]